MRMDWEMTDGLITFLGELIASSAFADTASGYYPWIGWTLGGTITGPDGSVTAMPPRYGVGLTRHSDISHDQMRLPSKKFRSFSSLVPKIRSRCAASSISMELTSSFVDAPPSPEKACRVDDDLRTRIPCGAVPLVSQKRI